MQAYRAAGILGVDTESRGALATTLTNLYLRGQLLWNPDTDADALLADFYVRFYGPAAKPMARYWGEIFRAWQETLVTEHEYFVAPAIYTPELIGRLRSHLEEKHDAKAELPLIGYISLKASDQIWLLNDREQRGLPLIEGMDAKRARAIELRGPTISALVKDGVVMYFHETKIGVGGECLDNTCFVETESGEMFIKLVERSNKAGHYRLHSLIDGGIVEAKLKRAAKIEHIRQ